MIRVYVKDNSKISNFIEKKLKDLCLRYKVIPEIKEEFDRKRPSIIEGEIEYNTNESIYKYLDLLESEMTRMREISADACYINPETGKTC